MGLRGEMGRIWWTDRDRIPSLMRQSAVRVQRDRQKQQPDLEFEEKVALSKTFEKAISALLTAQVARC
jgi:hypothetical protein